MKEKKMYTIKSLVKKKSKIKIHELFSLNVKKFQKFTN